MSKQPKISSDLENEFVLKATLGVTEMVHPSVMAICDGRGQVVDLPATRGALVTKQHYLQALHEFATKHPEVLSAMDEKRRRKLAAARAAAAKAAWAAQGKGFA